MMIRFSKYMPFRLGLAVLTLCVFGLAGMANAQSPEMHKGLKDIVASGKNVEYIGKENGMYGWVIFDDKNVQFAYTNDDGALITGLLYDANAELVTRRQVIAVRDIIKGSTQSASPVIKPNEKAPVSKAEQMYAEVERANWFTVGDARAPYIYAFVNTECSHCKDYWSEHLKPLVDAGSLHVRYVPVGGSEAANAQAASLLASKDAAKLWQSFADGSETLKQSDDAESLALITANNALFTKWKLPLFPFTVYRAKSDGEIKIISGVPSNTMMLMADMVK